MITKEPRVTHQGMKVLGCFAANPQRQLSGADITRAAGLLSGTLYPLLIRYENAGWLASTWEDVDEVAVGRPKRRLYRLTGAGERAYQQLLREVTGVPTWA